MPLEKGALVKIVDYDPTWCIAFEEISAVLSGHLGELVLTIEHVGSTAVPGLAAKPIIDLDVVIESMESLPEVVRILAKLGYWHEGDLGVYGREAFAREAADVPRDGTGRRWLDHHLYVCPKDSEQLAKQLAFRDYLRTHSEVAEKYSELKKLLAEQYSNNREAYSVGKSEFVSDVLRLAGKE